MDCFQPYLAELPPDVEILATLSASELDDWWERLNLPENTCNGAVAIEPWWKFWRSKRMTLQTGKQSGAAGE
jgi:hypothetical protein